MARIFIIIASLVFFMTTVAGISVYYLSQTSVNKAKNDAYYGLTRGSAQSISTRTTLLTQTLQGFSQSPELIKALRDSNFPRAKKIVQKMSPYLPGAMYFRLLLPTDTEPDLSITPQLGYADLDLIKDTFQKAQKPLIQGAKGKNRHLAITQSVILDDKVVAVIFASVDFSQLQNNFNVLANNNIYLELKQEDFVLFSHGDNKLKTLKVHTLVNVPKTAWNITYWSDDSLDLSSASLVLSIILIPAFISGLACYIAYRKLEALLISDQRSILNAAKDIMMDKRQGNYPIELKELSNFVFNLTQFKRAFESESLEAKSINEDDEFELGDFKEQSEHSDFLDSEPVALDIQKSESSKITTAANIGSAISLGDIMGEENSKDAESTPGSSVHSSTSLYSSDTIFRAYDIRGIVDKTLTKDVIYNIGRAIGSEAADKNIATIVIAKDGRTSSPYLCKPLVEGILTTGTDIIDIGTVPTPVLYFVAQHHEAHTGIMLTGSHNPAEYNGLKIVMAGETLTTKKLQALKRRIDNNDFHTSNVGSVTENNMFTNEYIGVITDDIRIARPMKVVIDAGNGVAGELGPTLLKTLGCEVIELFCDIDGTFPNHHPDPSNPDNLTDLISIVKHYQADLGIAFDGDGDRLGVVDSNGKIILPDRLMMLFSKHILAKQPGAEIIYDVKCSRNLAKQITKFGGRPTIWKTGHSFMKAKVKHTMAAFAGELSGHLFFNDRWYGFDDAMYSAARLIEILSEDTRISADVFADFPDSPNTPELSIDLKEGENFAMMQQLISQANFSSGKITDIDGLRVDFEDGFGLVRASNTTPSLVLRFEGETDESLTRIQDQFRQLILQIKPELSLPF